MTRPAPQRPLTPFEHRRGEPRPAGPCRVCGRLAWAGDEGGPVHPCCARVVAGAACGACEESLRLYAKSARMWGAIWGKSSRKTSNDRSKSGRLDANGAGRRVNAGQPLATAPLQEAQ